APTDLPTACHGAALRLTTVTRFPETITSVTSAPGIAKIASARGEPRAASDDSNRRTPPECTGRLTRNLQRALSIGSAVMRISAPIGRGRLWLRVAFNPPWAPAPSGGPPPPRCVAPGASPPSPGPPVGRPG